ncbi:dehydrodolichyl diphosphate synthase complex subunit Nus1 [Amyelois transitella]|uniref:dehydrodolichyl diphosphate synthase complex subunit Nus1 n=1 Tax=Amyelois transitella TaxID=680683 RepID=UPI002990110E|nr:dehydrodolichyl diphosphate synthase complex subunit Nus1 [Amyelois transitella]
MLSRLFRQFLFALVHWAVNILVAVQNVYQQFWVQKWCISSKSEVNKNDIKVILENMPKMKKNLKHLVVQADTDNHSLRDLARIVIWSLVAGIPFVSFHDITGELKENEEKLFHEVEKCKKGIPGFIKWARMPDLNGYTNGTQANTVTVNIFSKDDGRPVIAKCIQKIAEGKISCTQQSSELTAQEFGEVLSTLYPCIPDPELFLYTGSSCSTHGLLPWQIRLTEFVQLSIGHNLSVDSYVGALYKYNKCDQRFGK